MDNIADMDHTSTKWWVRLEQGRSRSRSRVLRNRVPHSGGSRQSPTKQPETKSGFLSAVPSYAAVPVASSSVVVFSKCWESR